jgi:hypothetical protein
MDQIIRDSLEIRLHRNSVNVEHGIAMSPHSQKKGHNFLSGIHNSRIMAVFRPHKNYGSF